MSLREDQEYLAKKREDKEKAKKLAEKKTKEETNKRFVDRDKMRADFDAKVDKLHQYKDDVKKALVKKTVMEFCVGSIDYCSPREYAICNNLVENYIEDAGVHNILHKMRFSNNGFLRECWKILNANYKAITEDATTDEDTQYMDSASINKFWNEIDDSGDIDDITNIIRMRVSNAEEDFINKNQEDKENVKTVLHQTASRVQAAKSSNDNDYTEAVEESETRLARERIYNIQHEGHRSVFDRIVRNLSEAAIKNNDAKDTFLDSNGKLDMYSVVESARCMYTLLETISTLQLENVDSKYIEDTLKSIK